MAFINHDMKQQDRLAKVANPSVQTVYQPHDIKKVFMTYQDKPEKAAEYLRQVIPMLSKYKVPATPINYSVWYNYVAGNQLALNEAINHMIEKGKPITDDFCMELYEAYVDGSAMIAAQDEIQKKLSKIVNQTIENVSVAAKEAQTFDTTLNDRSTELASAADAESTQMLIGQILADTRDMVRNSNALNSRMLETNEEVEKLRKELESVKESAKKDSLTGLFNRGALDHMVQDLVEKPVADPHPACLMMLDIDHFKKVNDNFGHLVGDRVIRYVSALLNQVIGENQKIARYGGEEFAVIMKNTAFDDVLKLAEKVRVALSKSKLQRKDSGETIGKVTISIGVAQQQSDDSAESFVERADAALYKAKNTGRDQVVSEHDLD